MIIVDNMQNISQISTRENLSTEIASILRKRIFLGDLAPGEHINELRLANELGLSRAPLREALNALRKEGAVVGKPRRGFFVVELSKAEVNDIYPIRAYLDPEALRLSGIPSAERFRKLTELNNQLIRARNVDRAIKLDDAWCYELWADCPNRVLIEIIEQFMWRTRRYELASMSNAQNVKRTAGVRSRILDKLKKGDLEGACAQLRQNLLDGAKPVLEWLDKREDQ